MWPTRSLGQRLQDSGLQLVGHNTRTIKNNTATLHSGITQTTPTASNFIMLTAAKMMARPKTTTETQTPLQHEEALPTTTGKPPTHTRHQPAITDVPMATAPSTQMARAPLPMPTSKRDVANDIAECSSSKQDRTATRETAPARPESAMNRQQLAQGSQQ